MGSNSSKVVSEVAVEASKNEANNNPDPRSPTPEIVRTPLQGKGGAKHNITKNVDLRKTFESPKGNEKLIHNNPILSAVIKNHLQSYDPRSPTQDFERTPIVLGPNIEDVNDEDLVKIQNENNCGSPCLRDDNDINIDSCEEVTQSPELVVPKNLCDGFFDLSLNDTIKGNEEPLGSSTASNETIEKNISQNVEKPSKLLETNFDYLESDNSEKFEDSDESFTKDEKLEKCIDNIKEIPLFKILNDDPRSPSVGIERTPIVVAKTTCESNVEDMSDDTLIKVLQNTNAELRQTVTKPQEKNTEGLLIYEDESGTLNDTPKKSKSNTSGCRTPLSCMKNKTETGHTRSKSANPLYDHKNQKAMPTKRASHIPRLKSLSKPTKLISNGSTVSLKNISSVIGGDCENTPPHSHRDRWDKDSSIIL